VDGFCSTITYDVLVRGGVKCTSALVKEGTRGREDLPWAVCSRGVKVIADVDFDDIEAEVRVSKSKLVTEYSV